MMTPEERTAHQARLKQGLKAEIKPGILYPDYVAVCDSWGRLNALLRMASTLRRKTRLNNDH